MNEDVSETVNSERRRRCTALKETIFCDPVHGQISFDSLCLKIIDTPEFQRLRFIKQMGFVYTVYPGANNCRFEHSLGVAYLSKKFLLELRNNQPELNITDAEIHCVQIAGLCHDLGHGPFSHSWESFMEKFRERRKDGNQKWKHEEASIKIFNYLIEKYGLVDEFKKFGINVDGINFIRNLIRGETKENERAFLYQIVNNEDSGLDVDKWDYYLRDCHYLGIRCGFEYKRLMQFARVIEVDGKKVICFRDKVINSVYGMFRTRSELHHVVYQHRMSKRIESAFCDALIKADGNVHAPNGEIFEFYKWTKAITENDKITESVMSNYCMMTDDIIYYTLKYSKNEEIASVVKLIETRFRNSKLYQVAACWRIADETEKDKVVVELMQCMKEFFSEEESVFSEENLTDSDKENFIFQNENRGQVNGRTEEIHSRKSRQFGEHNKSDFKVISEEDFIIQVVSINWGKKKENPADFVSFYSKDNMDKISTVNKEEANWMIPKTFEDVQLSVLCSREDADTYRSLKAVCEYYSKSKH